MKLSWFMGEPDTRRPLKDIRDLLEEAPVPEKAPSGGMMRDVETAISIDCVLASRNRWKKQSDPKGE